MHACRVGGDLYQRVLAKLRHPKLLLFEMLINAVHKAAPWASIAFNTRPEDTADAAARWVKID